jgi:hypothetical protein
VISRPFHLNQERNLLTKKVQTDSTVFKFGSVRHNLREAIKIKSNDILFWKFFIDFLIHVFFLTGCIRIDLHARIGPRERSLPGTTGGRPCEYCVLRTCWHIHRWPYSILSFERRRRFHG